MSTLVWHAPWALVLMLIPIALLLLALRQHSKLIDYADAALRPWAMSGRPQAGLGRMALHFGAWCCLVVALAGPRLPQESTELVQNTRADVRLIALLDVSESMQAADMPPSRMERARLKLDRKSVV